MFENFKHFTIHDITLSLHEDMICWPGEHHVFSHKYVKSINMGDHSNISRISSSMHTGTHLDTPHHKIDKRETLDDYDVSRFIGNAYVIDLTHLSQDIRKEDIDSKSFENYDYVLFKTSNSALLEKKEFSEDYISLHPSGAQFLVDQGIKGICIDYFSIDAYNADRPLSHEIIFNADVMLYEGVDLRKVNQGEYFFLGLPLKVFGAEGSLVRAILLEQHNG